MPCGRTPALAQEHLHGVPAVDDHAPIAVVPDGGPSRDRVDGGGGPVLAGVAAYGRAAVRVAYWAVCAICGGADGCEGGRACDLRAAAAG